MVSLALKHINEVPKILQIEWPVDQQHQPHLGAGLETQNVRPYTRLTDTVSEFYQVLRWLLYTVFEKTVLKHVSYF